MILLIMNFCVVTSFIFIVYKKKYTFFCHYMQIYIFFVYKYFFIFFHCESGWVDMFLHRLKFHERSERQSGFRTQFSFKL
jgi:hypothetical protein